MLKAPTWNTAEALVVIPAFNEEQDLGGVIRQIKELNEFDVLVVNDGSTDRTAEVACDAQATVLNLSQQLGAWGALQTGLRYALRNGYKYVLTMDADGQHEAVWIWEMFQPVISGDADVSIGSCVRRGSRARKLAWVLLKAASGLTMQDITSGFRVYNERAIRVLSGRQATLLDYQDVGVLVQLNNAGLRLTDVPVTMLPRSSGTSRVYHSWLVVASYMFQTLLLGISKRKVRNRDSKHSPSSRQER